MSLSWCWMLEGSVVSWDLTAPVHVSLGLLAHWILMSFNASSSVKESDVGHPTSLSFHLLEDYLIIFQNMEDF